MFQDEQELPPRKHELVFRQLDALSVKALEEYIAELQNEIERTRAEIARRGGAKAAAEAFFS